MKLFLYQACSGAIILLINDNYTTLSLNQLKDLDIPLEEIKPCDLHDLKKYYSL